MRRRSRVVAAWLMLLAAPAGAQVCDDAAIKLGEDGRYLGHLSYGEAPASALVEAPSGVAARGGCKLRSDMLPDLRRLLDAAAADPAAGGRLVAVSCFRSLAWQRGVFCKEALAAASRAISVAPPGRSEHSSGYALDFGVRPSSNCPDVDGCMAALPAYRWLVANAGRFGFEQSFPAGNKQNVKWEPWHWRWVGADANSAEAKRARFLFAEARKRFPAEPAVQ